MRGQGRLSPNQDGTFSYGAPSEPLGSDIEPLVQPSVAKFFKNLGPSGLSEPVAAEVAEWVLLLAPVHGQPRSVKLEYEAKTKRLERELKEKKLKTVTTIFAALAMTQQSILHVVVNWKVFSRASRTLLPGGAT